MVTELVPDRDNVVTSRDVIFAEEQPTSSEEIDFSSEVEVRLQNKTDHIPLIVRKIKVQAEEHCVIEGKSNCF